ncbi:MAG TPA: hypothetical protein DEB40_09735 [Elusimicrobia bacterium]|nr:hypothetical protein [Elusimicrobiota bacterium]HBT62010.1 hypothetical protein [Elusimicrobiota bacterium]
MIRPGFAAVLCLGAVLGGASSSAALAAPPQPSVFSGIVVDMATRDGWTLKAKYNPAKAGRMNFLLLHGTGGRKEDWQRLSRPLFWRGCGYLAMDLRGHGESRAAPEGKPDFWRKFIVNKEFNGVKNYNEFLNMMADVEAGIAYLASQGVPEEKIGIIGADVGGSLGLRYAALHPKIAMVILLSPGMKYQEVTTVNAIRAYKDRPVLMVYSDADKTSAHETPVLFSFAKMSVGEAKAALIVAPREHGAKMLRGQIISQVMNWIENPVRSAVAASSETAAGLALPLPDPEEDDDGDVLPPSVR